MNTAEPSIEELIGQSLGEASVCWSQTPQGVFDSTKCKAILDRIMARLNREEQGSFHMTSVTAFGFWDRIRVLFGRKLILRSKVNCQRNPGLINIEFTSEEVEPFFRRHQQQTIRRS